MKLNKSFAAGCTSCALALLIHQPLFAAGTEPQDPSATAQSATNTSAPTQQPGAVDSEGPLSRWLDMNTLSFSYRYREMSDNDGFHLFHTGQERSLIDGRFKLDDAGKYSVNFHVSSGRYFNWAYADNIGTGFGDLAGASLSRFSNAQLGRFFAASAADPVGVASIHIASRGWEMYVRQLYFSATPIKQLSFEYGAMGFERGANTEITSYDEDGYLEGGRVRLRDPQHLFFDQISATFGYVGDYFDPNLFHHQDGFTSTNYRQFLAEKKVGHRLKASVDYTYQNGSDTLREGLLVQVPKTHVLDSARVELYQRTNTVTLQGASFAAANGFAFTGSKTFAKKFQLEGGYDTIDQHYTVLTGSRVLDAVAFSINGDSWSIGPRFFTRANLKLDDYVTLFGFYTHQLSTNYYTVNKEGMNFGMNIDFRNLLNNKLHLGMAKDKTNN